MQVDFLKFLYSSNIMQLYVVTESGPLTGIITGAASVERTWPLGSALNPPAFDSYQLFVSLSLSSELSAP